MGHRDWSSLGPGVWRSVSVAHMSFTYFELLVLRFIRLWIATTVFRANAALIEGKPNPIWTEGVGLHKEVSHAISPKMEPPIDEET